MKGTWVKICFKLIFMIDRAKRVEIEYLESNIQKMQSRKIQNGRVRETHIQINLTL